MRVQPLNLGMSAQNRVHNFRKQAVGFKGNPGPDKATMLREAEQDLIRKATDFDADDPSYDDFIYYNPVYREGLTEKDLLDHYNKIHKDDHKVDYDPDDPCYEDYTPCDPNYR